MLNNALFSTVGGAGSMRVDTYCRSLCRCVESLRSAPLVYKERWIRIANELCNRQILLISCCEN
jgi:hypothetical protein